MRAQAVGQVDGVFDRQLGARADGKVRRVRRVAHQHHRRAAIGTAVRVNPGAADHARKTNPLRRAAQVCRVRHQRVATQVTGEQFFTERDAFLLAHVGEPCRLPDGLGCLDDEGGRGGVEAVRMRLEPAPRRFLEREGEGVEQLARAQPDETALAQVDVGMKRGGVLAAHAAVQAVAGNDQVGVDGGVVLHIGLELQVHTQLDAARLQDVEQLAPADTAKAVARRAHAGAVEVNLDVVPVVEGVEDLRRGLGVGALQGRQRLVREHHAPAEGVASAVALEHGDLMRRVALLHQQGQVQTRRAGTDAGDFHRQISGVPRFPRPSSRCLKASSRQATCGWLRCPSPAAWRHRAGRSAPARWPGPSRCARGTACRHGT